MAATATRESPRSTRRGRWTSGVAGPRAAPAGAAETRPEVYPRVASDRLRPVAPIHLISVQAGGSTPAERTKRDVARPRVRAPLLEAGVNVSALARQAAAQLLLVSPPRRAHPREASSYDPPAALARFRPGELIRSEPVHAYVAPGIRLRARAWRVLYRSTGAVGEPTAVSGTVLMPRRPSREPRPLIAYAIGTHGIGDAAAPSRLLPRGLDWEAGLMAMILARGWAVSITDYQGLGTPGDHAYMVGRALGPNVLDSMRVARELCPDELPADGPAAIIGYSEGGAAAAWAAQLHPTYAPEIELCGVVAGAAAADVETAGPSLDGTFFSFFMAYGGIGYAAAYPELQLDPYLTAMARGRIAMMRRSSVLQAALFGPRYIHADA